MAETFRMNRDIWTIQVVRADDPMLVDRTNTLTVATTDPVTKTVYLSEQLQGEFKMRVITHELGHCAMVSFGVLDEIHRMIPPESWIDVEEWACNFIADFGNRIINIARNIYGSEAWRYIPNYFNRWAA